MRRSLKPNVSDIVTARVFVSGGGEMTTRSLVSQRMLGIVCLVLLTATFLAAQQPAPPGQDPPPAQLLSPEQLDNLVAPVALYPDRLLSQVLVAATYPLEVVEAAQWLQQNRNLQGPQLVDAAREQNWDPSIQALVVFPDILNRLNSDIRWTTDLGNAFLAQQADVMNAVQSMRAQARAAGKLNSNAQETVTAQTQGDQTAIEIQPANPEVVYVPTYNPEYIWGPPAYGYYPPLYYPAFGYGFGFGPGIYIGGFFGGLGWGGWGWGPNWFGCSVFLNPFFFNHYGFHGYYGGGGFRGGVWAHNPAHRMGVPYSNAALAGRFRGATTTGAGSGRGQVGRQSYATARGSSGYRGNTGASGLAGTQGRAGSRAQAGSGWQHFGGPATGSSSYRGGTSYQSRPSNGGASRVSPSYRPSPSYSGGGSYAGSRPMPSYRSSPSYSGSNSYGGASRVSPSYRSSPSYSGGSSYAGARSMPSYRSSSGYGGGGGAAYRSSPSYGGGSSHSSGGSVSHSGGGSSYSGGGSSHTSGGGGGSHGGGGRR